MARAEKPVTSWAGRRGYRTAPRCGCSRPRPVRYLLLAKSAVGASSLFEPINLIDRLLPVYAEILAALRAAGAEWVQLDEPALVQDQPDGVLHTVARVYRELGAPADRPKILVAGYFDRLGDAMALLAKAPIDDLDADVISLEAACSHMEVAHELAEQGYPREVGPGVYDIHSPRVPDAEEVTGLLREALQAVPAERLWVNPDCGLKTRGWTEVRAALENLVSAAREVRAGLPVSES
jgi:5-methyltetrahydropteroyltriglutamate--homocysteine methyltransferase